MPKRGGLSTLHRYLTHQATRGLRVKANNRTRGRPERPTPGVESPASGGHTGGSRSSLRHNQAGSRMCKSAHQIRGNHTAARGFDIRDTVWSQFLATVRESAEASSAATRLVEP